MKITREDVLRVAELAHLELSQAEVDTYRGQLDSILEYVEKLDQLDTAHVEPMAGGQPSGISNLKSEISDAQARTSNLKSEISKAMDLGKPSAIANLESEMAGAAGKAGESRAGIGDVKSEIAGAGTGGLTTRIENLRSEISETSELREDVPWPAPPIDPAEALRAAPDPGPGSAGPFVRVPKVIDR